jgi:hypothetical protein
LRYIVDVVVEAVNEPVVLEVPVKVDDTSAD